jgi:LuxR family maltose regulon positive regulatory protein
LINRLNECLNHSLTLISAPAGFGKTTLLIEWISQTSKPISWISLDNGENDPLHFLQYLIAALQSVKPNIGKTIVSLLQSPQQPPVESILVGLLHEIAEMSDEFVLILDDYHSIDTEKIHKIVEFIIDHLPQQMHIVISTRIDPPLPLARLRVRNQLIEFRVSDLCFTLKETSQFLNKVMGLALSNHDVATLKSRTEGWAAGLQLAALSMRDREDIPTFIKTFAGDNRHIVDYLAEEVLNVQPEDVQAFLLQTCILNRLSGPFCDFVTNQNNSQKILEELERSNLFIIRLDNKRYWYRYHHLFADLLRQRLYQTQDKTTCNLINIKASEWCAENGLKEDAIEYALVANDFNKAVELIEKIVDLVWQRGGQTTLSKWLKKIPDEYIFLKPNLSNYYSLLLFESGKQAMAGQVLKMVEKNHISFCEEINGNLDKKLTKKKSSKVIKLQGRIYAIKAIMAAGRSEVKSIIKYSKKALDHLPNKDFSWRATIAISLGIAHNIRGDLISAVEAFSEGVKAARETDNTYFHLMSRLWLIMALNYRGQLPEAKIVCKQLLEEVNKKELSFDGAVGHVYGSWGQLLYELNNVKEAIQYVEKGIKLLEHGHDVSLLCWRYTTLAKMHFSNNNFALAEENLQKAEKLEITSELPTWITSHVKASRAKSILVKGGIDLLKNWVDDCKLKLDDDLSTMLRRPEHIMFARILMVQDRLDDALNLIQRLVKELAKGGRVKHQIETLLLQTQLYIKQDENTKAIKSIITAIDLGKQGGYIRIFIDEGQPIAELLGEIIDTKNNIPRSYAKKILSAFQLKRAFETESGYEEHLSNRELEVLKLIAVGFSNKKIMAALFISSSTVKTHLKNIYGKLDVHSRTEALVKAKELSLL